MESRAVCLLVAALGTAAVPGPVCHAQTQQGHVQFSASVGGLMFTYSGAGGYGFTFAGSASVRLVGSLWLGVAGSEWSGLVGSGCGVLDRTCRLTGGVDAMSTEVVATLYPMGSRLLRARLGGGYTYLRERIDDGGPGLAEVRSWPLTVLLSIGSDIPLAGQASITPVVEWLLLPGYEPKSVVTPRGVIFFGVELTGG